MIIDIRHKDPERLAITVSTVVFDDLTDDLLAVSASLYRFENTDATRFASECRRRLANMRKTIDLYDRRIMEESKASGKELRRQREQRTRKRDEAIAANNASGG